MAESSRDAAAHRRMLKHAEELTRGAGADVTTEPWPVTKARLGL